ncbi:E3 ubiquitin-protein ligase Midline-1 [Xenopus laevis]|uniref:E3 ubiquitin-protein ligase Midline-1 n=1 Tax=Xenopus laevis TaxID=8355 RepID=A0A8J0U471_XENLA|nr:E3 ubiquitin-protein ligase Midline-1 [Xenopus laevis]OCT58865.1 hypothetical protein XELAEV_18001353mg [Xenopus laevis]
MACADLIEELNCSLCLDIYTDPVMLPCGHNFCQGCIKRVLDTQEGCRGYSCPECRAEYQERPVLQRNRTLANIAERFLSSLLKPKKTGILCSYCVLSPAPAVKSCLHCETSLCDVHLTVHNMSVEHILTDPTTSFRNRKCSTHNKLLEYYCCKDGAPICVSCCLAGEHRGHRVELLSEASDKEKEKLRNVLEKMISERVETERRAKNTQRCTKKIQEKTVSLEVQIAALFSDIREQLEFLEKRLKIDLSWQNVKVLLHVSDLMEQLEKKKDELSSKIHHIEELCNMADPLTVLQERESHGAVFCGAEGEQSESKQNDETNLIPVLDLDVGLILVSLSTGLHRFLNSVRVNSKFCAQEASGMVLSINTASNHVAVSGDGKTATWTEINQNYPKTPERFIVFPQALSSISFSSGQHYWEVEGSESGGWRVGVAYPSMERRGEHSISGNNAKSWSLSMYNREYSVRHNRTVTKLPGKYSSQRFGIFLDYDAGHLSFYELNNPVRLLHTFTATFTEPLCPSFVVNSNSWVKIRNQ